MIQRCTNPKRDDYHLYGGRGITVCPRWREFWNFAKDMGVRPEGCTLDRREPNGNYEPENCRWATPKEQSETKRIKPVKACVDCGDDTEGRSWYGRCHRCNEYFRRNGVQRPRSSTEVMGIKSAKISHSHSKPVAQIDGQTGAIIQIHKSSVAAAKKLGSKYSTGINNCLSGVRPSALGFKWKYATPENQTANVQ